MREDIATKLAVNDKMLRLLSSCRRHNIELGRRGRSIGNVLNELQRDGVLPALVGGGL